MLNWHILYIAFHPPLKKTHVPSRVAQLLPIVKVNKIRYATDRELRMT
jgi:hypothetical protein